MVAALAVAAPDYTAKVDALLDRAVELGFTTTDFVALAVAAADQAGASVKVQDKIEGLLDDCTCECNSCRRTVGDR